MAGPSLTIDAKEFNLKMAFYSAESRSVTLDQMTKNGLDWQKEAQRLAPKDEGTLEGTGRATTRMIGDVSVETDVSFNTPYATRVHYEMIPAPHAKMHPGPLTKAKGGTEFGPAGGMYLTRPMNGKYKRWLKAVADRVKAIQSKGVK